MQNVTVLMIAFNARHTIERALSSALSQASRVIIVDDCSSDGTADFAESFASNSLKIIRNTQNIGTGGARSVAINSCESEFAIWLDADDMFLPDRVKHSLEILNSGADYVFDSAELYDGTSDEFIKELAIPNFLSNHIGLAYQIERNYIPSLGWPAVRTKVAQSVGYSKSLRGAEDYDHFLRAMLAGHHIEFSSHVNYRQYGYTGSVSRNVRQMNENVASLLLSLDDAKVDNYLRETAISPAETKWIWCNYLVRQGRYDDLLVASLELEAMIQDCELECLDTSPLPHSYLWKALFCKGVALLELKDFSNAEKAFIKLNTITLTPEGLNNLGVSIALQGKNGDAYFMEALAMKDNFLDAERNLQGADFSITATPLRVLASRDDYEYE